ncbi:hypothetical protein IWX75_002907 [Arthrobacter sp. CAN_A6]
MLQLRLTKVDAAASSAGLPRSVKRPAQVPQKYIKLLPEVDPIEQLEKCMNDRPLNG